MDSLTRRTASTAAVLLDELVLHVLRFPLWWYTRGVADLARNLARGEAEWLERLGLRVILVNMFVPMFGDYSRSGRVISFFMRIVLLVGKGIVFIIVSVVLFVIFLVYLALPPILTLQLIEQFGGPQLL